MGRAQGSWLLQGMGAAESGVGAAASAEVVGRKGKWRWISQEVMFSGSELVFFKD